ncbi:MAG: DUF4956 domain-containing protein [Clostridia bacterium]|nr:DUF4956 domain-containing protein [Clostridia bacterium]
MFDSIFSSTTPTVTSYFMMMATAIVAGFIYAFVMSFRVRANKRFFIVTAIMPFVVATIVAFVQGNIGVGIAIGGGVFGLVRFRSAQGSSDEIAAVLISMCGGLAFGLGYLAYGVIILLALSLLFFLFSVLPLFEHSKMSKERLLRITIPESLEYVDVFDDIFKHYLSAYESVGVKTTGMGSMFRLSFRIVMKNPAEEKKFIDELRTRNGNLEIAVTPYVEEGNTL